MSAAKRPWQFDVFSGRNTEQRHYHVIGHVADGPDSAHYSAQRTADERSTGQSTLKRLKRELQASAKGY